MTAVAELPRVSGPHRNRALAAARHARAVELAAAGRTYEQIAGELGYANRGTVHRIVAQALRRETTEAVGELRRLEVDRLDALQQSLWESALRGDVNAAKAVLRIIETRCRLLGLSASGPNSVGPRAVVVPSD